MKQEIDNRKVATFVVIIVLSGVVSCTAQPLIHGNEKAVDLIVNVFSILAGFLVAIMTLFSDFSINNETNWREVTLKRHTISVRAAKNKNLFYCYLLVLVFVFISVLLSKSTIEWHQEVVKYAECIYLFLACIAWGYSLFLPNNIYRLQKEKLDSALKECKPNHL